MSRRRWVLLVGLIALAWSGTAAAGPLDSLTNWLREQFAAMFAAFMRFMGDLFLVWLEHSLSMVKEIIAVLPAPTFLSEVVLCSLLAQAGPWAQWVVGTFHLGEAMGILAAALIFRLLRVFLTLFQWT